MYDFKTIVDRCNTGSMKWDTVQAAMGQGNDDVIPLSIADMDIKTAPEIIEAIKSKTDEGIFGYNLPTTSYYDAVIGWIKRRHDWDVDKDWITLSQGVVSALFTAVRAFTNPGDKVIVQSPVYYPFYEAVGQNGCEIADNRLINNNGRYEMDFDDLEKKAKDKSTKVMILCSPHNPVGRVWTVDELKRLGEICLKNNVIVVSDEIHFDIVYSPFKHCIFSEISSEFEQNCLVLTAPSKTFNIAGLKTSNIIIPNKDLKKKFDAASDSISWQTPNYLGLIACEAAYLHGEKWFKHLMKHLEQNRKLVKEYITENIRSISVSELEGTYLMWLDCRSLGMDKNELENFMRNKARVYFDEGYIFGELGEGFERINIACPTAMLKKALNNIRSAMDDL